MTSHSPRATHTSDDAADSEARSSSTARPSGSIWPFLLASGFVFGGVALAALPSVLPQYAWITRSFAKYGLSSGSFAVSGCVLFGVAWMLRAQAQSAAQEPEPETTDRDLILDQLASELAQMRGGIQELRVEFVYLKDAQQALLQAQGERNSDTTGDVQQAAIFRLAASLDQVGARLEQRLNAQHGAVQSSLDQLNQGLQATWLQIAAVNGRADASAGIDAEEAAELELAIERTNGHPHDGHGEGSTDEVDVWVELEEATAVGSLGLLDTLDDPALAQQPSKPSGSLRLAHGKDSARAAPEPQAPLPREGHEGRRDEAPIEGKLALLKSLLADARVRQALESMRRAER